MTDKEVWIGLGLIVLLIAGLGYQKFLGGGFTPRETTLQQVFRISEDADVMYFGGYSRVGMITQYAAIVEFSDAEFEAYAALVDDRRAWRGVTYEAGGAERRIDAHWQEGQTGLYSNHRYASWGPLRHAPVNEVAASDMTSFCYGWVRQANGPDRAVPCGDTTERDSNGTIRAMLDRRKKRLYAYIRE